MSRPLKILHIISGDLWAGAEVQAFTLMSHLAKLPGSKVAAVVLNDGTLAAKLRAAGISVRILDEREIGPIGIYRKLRHFLRAWSPDVIHTHRTKETIIGSLANRTCQRVPCLRTVHGGNERASSRGIRGIRQQIIRDLDRWCGRKFQQRIVSVTDELGRRLAAEFPASRIVVVENGVDADLLRAGREVAEFRRRAPDSTHIGIVGRLVDVKRVDVFVMMASLLRLEQTDRKWQFHIFGDGPLRPSLEALAKRLQIMDAMEFHGHRHDMATCIGGLDALVICSDHEGLPMTALEALALEIPTVAHAVGGLIEVVPQEFLVVHHNAKGYKRAVLTALSEDGRVLTKVNTASRLSMFSAERNASRILALYDEMIAESLSDGQ